MTKFKNDIMFNKKPTKMSQGFTSTRLEEERALDKRETFTISINKEERKQLDDDKKLLEQSKDSTCVKQLWQLGRFVLHDDKMGKIMHQILGNRNKNKRIGITDFE